MKILVAGIERTDVECVSISTDLEPSTLHSSHSATLIAPVPKSHHYHASKVKDMFCRYYRLKLYTNQSLNRGTPPVLDRVRSIHSALTDPLRYPRSMKAYSTQTDARASLLNRAPSSFLICVLLIP